MFATIQAALRRTTYHQASDNPSNSAKASSARSGSDWKTEVITAAASAGRASVHSFVSAWLEQVSNNGSQNEQVTLDSQQRVSTEEHQRSVEATKRLRIKRDAPEESIQALKDQVAFRQDIIEDLRRDIARKTFEIKLLEDELREAREKAATQPEKPSDSRLGHAEIGTIQPLTRGKPLTNNKTCGLLSKVSTQADWAVLSYLALKGISMALRKFDWERSLDIDSYRDLDEPRPVFLGSLGTGNMASVQAALLEGEPIAVKQFRVSEEDIFHQDFHLDRMCELAWGNIKALENEAATLAFLWTSNDISDLPHVVAIRNGGYREFTDPTDRKKVGRYLYLEKCDGSVQDLIQSRPLDNVEAFRLFKHIVKGLAAIHKRGFTHADLKPANVLFTTRSNAQRIYKIADFGCSVDLREGEKIHGQTGTQLYLAPERWMNDEGVSLATQASDIFAAYCTFLEVRGLLDPYMEGAGTPEQVSVRRLAAIEDAACADKRFPMFRDCIRGKSNARPTAEEILNIFKNHPGLAAYQP